MARKTLILVITFACCIFLFAQDEMRRSGGRWADKPHISGQITAIRNGAVEVLTPDQRTTTIKTGPGTQFRKHLAEAKLEDFSIGDRIFAVGEQQKDGEFLATFVAGGFPNGAPQGGGGSMSMTREDFGKKFIVGEVKKIDQVRLTILRPDAIEQVIEVDENTSFRNEKDESVTLADMKVGDHVRGRGELKNGIFVPQVLRVGVAPQGRYGFGPMPQSSKEPK